MPRKVLTPQVRVLKEAKHFVIYGVSRSRKGYAKDVADAVAKMRPNCKMTLVHPQPDTLQGFKANGDLGCSTAVSARSVLNPRECLAIIALGGDNAKHALEDAISAGIGTIWLAMNATTPETKAIAEARKRKVISGCPILFVDKPEGVHAFHSWLAKVFGKI